MFRLKSGHANNNLLTAIKEANELFTDKEHLREIGSRKFDMSTCHGRIIAEDIIRFNSTANIIVYKPFNRWSRALGYYDKKHPYNIYINSYKMNRSVGSFVDTLWHELIHMLDGFNKHHSYGHGDNSPNGKSQTAPYWIGRLAGKQPINIRLTYWQKVKRFLSRIF